MKLSKYILVFEALLMTYPTFLGALICFGAISPFIVSGDIQFLKDFILGVVLLLSLISGWRIFFWVIYDGPKKGEIISFFWLVMTFIGAIIAIISLFSFLISKLVVSFGLPLSNSIFIYGSVFLIPLCHLLLEFKMQKKC